MIDILIIGGGPAGLTAALYAARNGKSVTVAEKNGFGGQIVQTPRVDNYPGLPGISGMELGEKLCTQAVEAGADIEFSAAEAVEKRADGIFSVKTEDGEIEAKAVIFAGGAEPKKLGLPNEEALTGNGVNYCALCDGSFFKNEEVAVIGGGNTAYSDALILSELCKKVTVIHLGEATYVEKPLLKAVENRKNIEFRFPCRVIELQDDEQLEGIVVENIENGQSAKLPVKAVFVAMGRVPDCRLIAQLAELDENGYALTDENCAAKTAGLYIAGDCRAKKIRQLTTAVADGTVSALAACDYIDSMK